MMTASLACLTVARLRHGQIASMGMILRPCTSLENSCVVADMLQAWRTKCSASSFPFQYSTPSSIVDKANMLRHVGCVCLLCPFMPNLQTQWLPSCGRGEPVYFPAGPLGGALGSIRRQPAAASCFVPQTFIDDKCLIASFRLERKVAFWRKPAEKLLGTIFSSKGFSEAS